VSSSPRLFSFIGGTAGSWCVTAVHEVIGETLPIVARLQVAVNDVPHAGAWSLRGISSNDRYVIREEKTALASKQEGLGRSDSILAALIPIRKTPGWWLLTQDERRDIFEAQSHHIRVGMQYLPAIARKLHHCRDLSPHEPFDFLTWFEYAPTDAAAFDELVRVLRTSPEWAYVDREVDVRLIKAGESSEH
jgi:hypothetical protein